MILFAWFVFAWLWTALMQEFGMPVRVSQIVRGVLLLLMLFALLGLFGRYGRSTEVSGLQVAQEVVGVPSPLVGRHGRPVAAPAVGVVWPCSAW